VGVDLPDAVGATIGCVTVGDRAIATPGTGDGVGVEAQAARANTTKMARNKSAFLSLSPEFIAPFSYPPAVMPPPPKVAPSSML
jgi:hypothetical protein